MEAMWPVAIRDRAWFVVSDHIVVPALNDTPGLRFYPDSPRIFIWSIAPDATGPNVVVVTSDLRRDALRGVAKDPTLATAIASHKLWCGTLEGALEHELGAPDANQSNASFVTTSALTEAGALVAFGPGSAVAAADPETQARLQASLAAGDTIIVPKQVLSGGLSGWWRVAPQSGDVSPVLDGTLNGNIIRTNTLGKPAEVVGSGRGVTKPGAPSGNGTASVNADDPFYKYAERNAQLICDRIGAGIEAEEDRASSGRVCKESTPSWGKIGVVAVEVGTVLWAIFEAWKQWMP
jgi:hypothetical protein